MTPTANLVRALGTPDALQLRSDRSGAGGSTMFGHFAVFGVRTEINNRYEGNFLEEVAPTAFDRAAADPSRVKVLFDHGADPSVGSKPLGTLDVFRAEKQGQAYEVGLFDAGYVNDLKPAIAAGTLGASFRFSVADGGETWQRNVDPTPDNPKGLPIRTLHDVHLFEFGPVPFPAYAAATAGMRSLTPDFLARLDDERFVRSLARRLGDKVVQNMLDAKRDIVIVTDDEEPSGSEAGDACCCANCGVMFDTSVAPACPVCQTPAPGAAGGMTGMNSADVPAPRNASPAADGARRGLPLIAARHELTIARSIL